MTQWHGEASRPGRGQKRNDLVIASGASDGPDDRLPKERGVNALALPGPVVEELDDLVVAP